VLLGRESAAFYRLRVANRVFFPRPAVISGFPVRPSGNPPLPDAVNYFTYFPITFPRAGSTLSSTRRRSTPSRWYLIRSSYVARRPARRRLGGRRSLRMNHLAVGERRAAARARRRAKNNTVPRRRYLRHG